MAYITDNIDDNLDNNGNNLDNNDQVNNWADILGVLGATIKGFDTVNDIIYNNEDPLGNTKLQDIALRGTAQDRHVINRLRDFIFTGNGLWGKSSEEKEYEDAAREARSMGIDFSNVRNNDVLENVWNPNSLPKTINMANIDKTDTRARDNAYSLNKILDSEYQNSVGSFYNTAANNQRRFQRQNMMNYFAEGGSLDEQNGITSFNTGSSHEQNPYGGIQQGIASDGLPNQVEENEKKYKDYIYSARLKPSKSLLKQYNLPEKYVGLTYAELCDKLQKESEDRPNDPVSLKTLDEWMSRLAGAQEEQKAKIAERKIAKTVDNMTDEQKAAIMSSLEQPMAQQEGIDLGQPMYRDGGKIFIKPENRGKFTALKKRTGKSASWFKAHGTPAQKKMATFALNAKKWSHKHEDGGHLFAKGGPENNYELFNTFGDYINPYGVEFNDNGYKIGLDPESSEYLPLHVMTHPEFFFGDDSSEIFNYDGNRVYYNNGTKQFYDTKGVTDILSGQLVDPNNYHDVKYFSNIVDENGNYRAGYEDWVNSLTEEQFKYLTTLMDDNTRKLNPDLKTFKERALDKNFEITHSFINSLYRNPKYRLASRRAGFDTEDNANNNRNAKRGKKTIKLDDIKFDNENSWLRYAPVVGSGLGAAVAALQPVDYTLSNRYKELASEYNQIAAPNIGGYRRYTPYDINLGDAENLAVESRAIDANRGQNRVTQGALNVAAINAMQKANALRNLEWQKANEANRLAVDQYNLGIDQYNVGLAQAYDNLNANINAQRIGMLANAAQAADASETAWANNISNNATNFFNNLGDLGRDEWARLQLNRFLSEYNLS